MRRLTFALLIVLGVPAFFLLVNMPASGQQPAPYQIVAPTQVPEIPYESVPNFFKYPFQMNLGDMPAVTVNSKGHVYMLSRSNVSGPAYAQMGAQVLEFDENGNFIRELAPNLYAWSLGHGIRVDREDFVWVVDRGSDMVVKLNPATGHAEMVFGRRGIASDEDGQGPRWGEASSLRGTPKYPPPEENMFRGPTDVTWDPEGNAYIADGYINSRVAKFNKEGVQIGTFGEFGRGPMQFSNPHSVASDARGNMYVADRGNALTKVFDRDWKLIRTIDMTKVPYPKDERAWNRVTPKYGEDGVGVNRVGAPWNVCITPGPTQYLYIGGGFPSRVYKVDMNGKVLGMFGKTGKLLGQFGWIHGMACPSENLIYVADENNWRVQRIILHPEKMKPSGP